MPTLQSLFAGASITSGHQAMSISGLFLEKKHVAFEEFSNTFRVVPSTQHLREVMASVDSNVCKHAYIRGIEADAVIYNATISACGESGPWRVVGHLLSDMHVKQIRCDIVTFGAAIDSWKKSGCWQHAILQLAELQSIRVSPNLVIYNAALATCEKGGAWQAALSLLSDLRQLQLRDDVATMGSLMSACVRCTQPDQALHLFSTFTGSRAEANAACLIGLLTLVAKAPGGISIPGPAWA